MRGKPLIFAMCAGQVGNLLPHVVVPAVMVVHLIPLWGLTNAQAGLLAAAYAAGYMLAVPRGEGKPVAVVPSIQPTAYYTGTNGSDHLRASMGDCEFGWDAFGNALLAIAQRAIRFVVNPV